MVCSFLNDDTVNELECTTVGMGINIKNLLQRGDFFYTMSTTIKKNITKVTCNLKLN